MNKLNKLAEAIYPHESTNPVEIRNVNECRGILKRQIKAMLKEAMGMGEAVMLATTTEEHNRRWKAIYDTYGIKIFKRWNPGEKT